MHALACLSNFSACRVRVAEELAELLQSYGAVGWRSTLPVVPAAIPDRRGGLWQASACLLPAAGAHRSPGTMAGDGVVVLRDSSRRCTASAC